MKCNKILKNLCKVVTIILSAASAFSLFACSIKNSSESSDSDILCVSDFEYDIETNENSSSNEIPYFLEKGRSLAEDEYFEILLYTAKAIGYCCDGFGEDFENASNIITQENFLFRWNADEGYPLMRSFPPECCYLISGSGIMYTHFKIEGDFVLTFSNGLFYSLSCMRDGEIIEFQTSSGHVKEFLEKYSKTA